MFNFYGSKRRLAKTYPEPEMNLIIEPFAGAAGYSVHWLMARPSLRAILIDKDPLVVAMWKRLLSMDSDELRNYPNPQKGDYTTDWLYLSATVSRGSWVQATKGEAFKITAWMARDFDRTKKRLADTVEKLRGRIHIVEKDYASFPSSVKATWFIDPPYQHQGHEYAQGSSAIDYNHLAAWVQRCQGQVIVTEASPADWLPFRVHQQSSNMRNGRKTELVWYASTH